MGMSFYYKDGAPFLPFSILQKCLKHFNEFGYVLKFLLVLLGIYLVQSHVAKILNNFLPLSYHFFIVKILGQDLRLKLGYHRS